LVDGDRWFGRAVPSIQFATNERVRFAMTDIETLNARIDALEMRLAHQDRAIDDLNETITGQWKEFENLTRRIARLGAQLQDVQDRTPSAGEPEPPPHY
jgi:SlyX protein